MEIQLNGVPFEANGRNISLYHYSGELACFTHIFMETSRDETLGMAYGGYLWCDEPGFNTMREFIVEYEYPLYLNQKEVKRCDETAWHEKHAHDLDNFNTLEDLDGG